MKKMFVITVVVVAVLLAASVPALAESEKAAIVLKGDDHPYGCFTSLLGVFLITYDAAHTVGNSSDLVKLVCHFEIPEGYAPEKVYKSEGFGCGIYFPTGNVGTTNTRFVATPGGTATMECTYKP